MAGRGLTPSAYAISPGQGFKFDVAGNALVQLADPTGTDEIAQSGRSSVGPALAQAVLDATGGRFGVVLVNTAVGSSTISMWGPDGTSWLTALPMWNAAVADALAQKLNIVGCAAAVIHGETDAGLGTPPEVWKAGILSLRDRMRTATGLPALPFVMSQIGIDMDAPDSPAWAALRAAQSELARAGEIILASRAAKHFGAREMMQDRLHYNARGLDEIGSALGQALANVALGAAPVGFDA
ncbi:sialate O-acetylesterase [Stenotrophomonas sp. TWI809]|uniref:sialate O-acetylesterase n=1 Tax=Stenotrophomonas sp. TWI809 TaxID=3136796 RepID=UPI003207C765